jgi:hypothetical protein
MLNPERIAVPELTFEEYKELFRFHQLLPGQLFLIDPIIQPVNSTGVVLDEKSKKELQKELANFGLRVLSSAEPTIKENYGVVCDHIIYKIQMIHPNTFFYNVTVVHASSVVTVIPNFDEYMEYMKVQHPIIVEYNKTLNKGKANGPQN